MVENLHAGACVATLGFLIFTACSSTAPAKGKAWESMDRPALDQAYNNSAAVPEGARMFKEWQARSAQVREQPSGAGGGERLVLWRASRDLGA